VPVTSTTSLKITTGKYYTPSGRSIQRIDHSHNNKVFIDHDKLKRSEFYTDNMRPIFSAGGIIPDSVVHLYKSSRVVNMLLTKGMFFKFATNYYNLHPETDFINLESEKIFSSFVNYLNKNNFSYFSEGEVLFRKLNDEFSSNSAPDSFYVQLNKLKSQFVDLKENELNRHKEEIIAEIRQEFAARLFGRSGRIKESLKNDSQLSTAIQILNNHKLYNKILNIIE